jgi:hypothetical protein
MNKYPVYSLPERAKKFYQKMPIQVLIVPRGRMEFESPLTHLILMLSVFKRPVDGGDYAAKRL